MRRVDKSDTAKAGDIVHISLKKNEAIQAVRAQLKKNSVRGLLCWPCNRGLITYGDNPARLRRAVSYLEAHQKAGIKQT
jgi:hypothetical protein